MTNPDLRPTPPRNDFLDRAKGLLIAVVTWGHLVQFCGYRNEGGFWTDPVFVAAYSFHMPLFMALSGYLARGSIYRTEAGRLVGRRAVNLALPAVLWGSISVAVDLDRGQSNRATLVSSFLATAWFLWALYVSVLIAVLLRRLRADHAVGLLLACLVTLLVPKVNIVPLFDWTFPGFCLGYWLAGNRASPLARALQRPETAIAAIGVWAFCLWHWQLKTFPYLGGSSVRHGGWHQIALRDVAFLSGSVLFLWFACQAKVPLAERVGRQSLNVYLLQGWPIQWLGHLALPLRGRPTFAFVVGLPLAISLTVALAEAGRWLQRSWVLGLVLFGRLPPRPA